MKNIGTGGNMKNRGLVNFLSFVALVIIAVLTTVNNLLPATMSFENEKLKGFWGKEIIIGSNKEGDTNYPLKRFSVANSIITGYSSDEIMGVNGDDESSFNYSFTNCLLNTPAYESPEIISCLWDSNENPVCRADNFAPAFDTDRLIYTFTLDSQSVAVGSADTNITMATYPYDRLGNPRLTSPSMGCYEVQMTE